MSLLLGSSYLMLCISWSHLNGGKPSCGPPPDAQVYNSPEDCAAALEGERSGLEASLKTWVSSHFKGQPEASWPDKEWIECRS